MKSTHLKVFLKFALAIFAIAFIAISCTEDEIIEPTDTTNQDDIKKPIIKINGDTTIILELGDIYVDSGATANDNIDGDLTSQINVSNPVKTDEVGTYIVVYSVSDKAGNQSIATRTVIVKANKLAGTYKCNYVVTGIGAGNHNGTEHVISLDVAPFNKVLFTNFSGFYGLNVEATCEGKNIVINMVKTFDWDGDGTPTPATITGNTTNAFTITSGATVNAEITMLNYIIDYGEGNIDSVEATYSKQ